MFWFLVFWQVLGLTWRVNEFIEKNELKLHHSIISNVYFGQPCERNVLTCKCQTQLARTHSQSMRVSVGSVAHMCALLVCLYFIYLCWRPACWVSIDVISIVGSCFSFLLFCFVLEICSYMEILWVIKHYGIVSKTMTFGQKLNWFMFVRVTTSSRFFFFSCGVSLSVDRLSVLPLHLSHYALLVQI